MSTTDGKGGAGKIAYNLHVAYQTYGYPAWLAVRAKGTNDPDILPIPNDTSYGAWARLWLALVKVRGGWRLQKGLQWIAQPSRQLKVRRGYEDFEFPGIWRIFNSLPERPDIIHCHNLHGDYFDLRALPWLSQQAALVLTLHDTWLLSGHCAYSLGCERWKIGCGHCPDLAIYPAVRRDQTAYNWQQKRTIYAKSRLHVATPCRWLMQKVEQSILAPAVGESRVIPYGVELSVFHAADRQTARTALEIPPDVTVILFTANGVLHNRFKDYSTMRTAIAKVANRNRRWSILFIVLGEESPAERIDYADVRFVPYQQDPAIVARYYQAADLYLHAAQEDTFPNVVLEALACGKPVVATAVGGIPEQVKGLGSLACRMSALNRYGANEATGVLVPREDAEGMAASIEQLLDNESLCRQIGENAARDAQKRFNLQRQVNDYLQWYEQLRYRTTPALGD